MDTEQYLKDLRQGCAARGGSELHRGMHRLAEEAMRLTAELNGSYHSPEERRTLFSKITGRAVDDTFCIFPPFYTECGKIFSLVRMYLSIAAVIFRTGAACILGMAP